MTSLFFINTSGSTPKDLFDDTTKELEIQYHDDKTQIKDALKMGKITLTSRSTFEDFKASISMDNNLEKISEINMKLVFDELLERLREKLQKLGDNFADLLYSIKDINASSHWDECKSLFEECQEYISLNDERYAMEVFEEYITHLQEKAKLKAKREKGREEKEKEKERREREKEADWSHKEDVESENFDFKIIHLRLRNYLYSFEFPVDNKSWRASVHRYRTGKTRYAHYRQSEIILSDSGWHCSFCFRRIDEFIFKIKAYSHVDRVRFKYFLKPARIQNLICQGKDLFDMIPEEYTFKDLIGKMGPIPRSYSAVNLPGHLIQNAERYKFLLPGNCRRSPE